jgi:biotin carboxylase
VSTLAMDDVLALARERKAALVIAACVDRANVTAAYVAERLGLPAPYGFATAALVADKLAMKQRLTSHGVPTAPFVALRSAAVQLPFGFPVVVKPVDTGGSKAVRRASDREALRLGVEEAFKATRAEHVLVESFIEGIEVSADCLVQDGEPHILLLRRKYVLSGREGEVLASYASVSPAMVSATAEARIREATRAIVRAFALRTTPLLVQFIVAGDDVHVIELAPRVGGGTNQWQVMLRSGVDMVEAAIDSYLGRCTVLTARSYGGYLLSGHVYAAAGRFGEVRNVRPLLAEGIVEAFYTHKSRGAPIGSSMSASDRVASFIARADSGEALVRKTREAMRRLDVVDVDGRSILRRDIFLNAL